MRFILFGKKIFVENNKSNSGQYILTIDIEVPRQLEDNTKILSPSPPDFVVSGCHSDV